MTNLTFLDCGVWQGDGKSIAARRPFAVAHGQTLALCEYAGTQPMQPWPLGDAADLEAIHRLLGILAGPMRFDVTIRDVRRLDAPLSDALYIFLPEMHLPLVPRLPDVDPKIVPDPNQATCACHGPVIKRLLYGAPEAKNQYRVVAAPISRNPNDWFYWLAEMHRAVADDLIKFLDRLAKVPAPDKLRLVQLGGLVEVWPGYRCAVQSLGWAAYVEPTVVADLGPEKLLAEWSDKTVTTKHRDAVERALVWTRKGAVLLHASEQPSLERAGEFVAELRSDDVTRTPPMAFLALREQKARLVAANVKAPEGHAARALSRAVVKTAELGASLYVTSGAGEPFVSSFPLQKLWNVLHGSEMQESNRLSL